MILVLARDGTPVLQPVFYGERDIEVVGDEDVVEVVASVCSDGKRRAALSRRLVDALAMQRRDVLASHVASAPGLRSEECRVGQECFCHCIFLWSPSN